MYDSPSMPMHQGRVLGSISFREIDLPQVTEWQVNNEYYLIVKVKMTGKNEQYMSDAPEDENKLEGSFEIKSVRALGKEPLDLKTAEQKDWEDTVARAMQGKL